MKRTLILATLIALFTLTAPSAFAQCAMCDEDYTLNARCIPQPSPSFCTVSYDCGDGLLDSCPKCYGPCTPHCIYTYNQQCDDAYGNGGGPLAARAGWDAHEQIAIAARRLARDLSLSDYIDFENGIDTAIAKGASTASVVAMYVARSASLELPRSRSIASRVAISLMPGKAGAR